MSFMDMNQAKAYIEELRENETRGTYITALTYAIEAMEKQIPKRPQSEYDNEFVCSCCNATIEDDNVTTIKRCPECGQLWEWGE